jgi:riboflavin synthase
MFTGIVEEQGTVKSIKKEKENLIIEIESKFSSQLKIDQSVAHNGVCLTVVKKTKQTHFVTAVKETLDKSNLRFVKKGSIINLERSLIFGGRLDGHLVQGHVDHTSKVLKVTDHSGSKEIQIELNKKDSDFVIGKGSICINGISLTVSKLKKNSFSVVIIPFTLEHTNIKHLKKGDLVNVEYDVLGKYVSKILKK